MEKNKIFEKIKEKLDDSYFLNKCKYNWLEFKESIVNKKDTKGLPALKRNLHESKLLTIRTKKSIIQIKINSILTNKTEQNKRKVNKLEVEAELLEIRTMYKKLNDRTFPKQKAIMKKYLFLIEKKLEKPPASVDRNELIDLINRIKKINENINKIFTGTGIPLAPTDGLENIVGQKNTETPKGDNVKQLVEKTELSTPKEKDLPPSDTQGKKHQLKIKINH